MSVETASIAGLLAAALGGENDETSWLAIRELQKRATPPAFEAACALCADSDPVRRSCGAKILSEFGYAGWSGEDLSTACAGALLPLLEDIDENVLRGRCGVVLKDILGTDFHQEYLLG